MKSVSCPAWIFWESPCSARECWRAFPFCSEPNRKLNIKHPNRMKTHLATLFAITSLTAVALAAPQTFDFKDPKSVNNAVFKLDAPLEAITGSANGISGTVTFDPENPSATKGKIVVAAATLHVPNSMMQGHLQGNQWMDV